MQVTLAPSASTIFRILECIIKMCVNYMYTLHKLMLYCRTLIISESCVFELLVIQLTVILLQVYVLLEYLIKTLYIK